MRNFLLTLRGKLVGGEDEDEEDNHKEQLSPEPTKATLKQSSHVTQRLPHAEEKVSFTSSTLNNLYSFH
jgi:hypothetical protein